MLFDLRGSGRRRVVKIVYITLAFLMGGGLVLFGIGGGGALPGGLVDAITQGGGGGDDGTDRFRDAGGRPRPRRRAPTRPTPRSGPRSPARASTSPTRARTSTRTPATTRTPAPSSCAPPAAPGRSTSSSRASNPDSRVASLMVQAYAGLGELDKATAAQEIIAEDRNSAGAYATLATSSPTRRARSARATSRRDKALELTEPDMREALRGQLEQRQARRRRSRPPRRAAASATPTPTPRRRRSSPQAATIRRRALVAQLAEQRTLNPKVPGSIPGGGTLTKPRYGAVSFCAGSLRSRRVPEQAPALGRTRAPAERPLRRHRSVCQSPGQRRSRSEGCAMRRWCLAAATLAVVSRCVHVGGRCRRGADELEVYSATVRGAQLAALDEKGIDLSVRRPAREGRGDPADPDRPAARGARRRRHRDAADACPGRARRSSSSPPRRRANGFKVWRS